MTTIQGLQQTPQEVGPHAHLPRKPDVVHSNTWKNQLEKFIEGEPKVLGVVQIVIALVNFSFGLTMMSAPYPFNLTKMTKNTIWGPVIFMVSGSLSIAAGTRTSSKALVISSLCFNIISSVVAAAVSIISVFSVAMSVTRKDYLYVVLLGMDILICIFHVFEFCITLSLSAFGCKATCCYSSDVVIIMPSDPITAEMVPSIQS